MTSSWSDLHCKRKRAIRRQALSGFGLVAAMRGAEQLLGAPRKTGRQRLAALVFLAAAAACVCKTVPPPSNIVV